MAQTDWFAQYKLTSAQQRYVAAVQVRALQKKRIMFPLQCTKVEDCLLCADMFGAGEMFRNRPGLQ